MQEELLSGRGPVGPVQTPGQSLLEREPVVPLLGLVQEQWPGQSLSERGPVVPLSEPAQEEPRSERGPVVLEGQVPVVLVGPLSERGLWERLPGLVAVEFHHMTS